MAQSATVPIAHSPVGIPFFWESGMEPPVEWPTWAATLKLAIMAKNSINVDSLLKQKPDIKDLTYPAEPTYEPAIENETQAQHRERDIRNNKRKADWENECKQIAFRGPFVDNVPWDEADLKVRSLIYLSLGTEGQRIYQQRFPHSEIERITVFELAHELSLTFTQPRNITYDRFLLFTCKQKPNEKLESFHCRLKALGAKCRLGSAEEDLIKDIFIAFMTNTDIQRELLMETRTAQQVIQFALNRERGQESQKAINTHLNRFPTNTFEQISNISSNPKNPTFNPKPRTPTRNNQQQRPTSITNPCRRCGLQFTQEHLLICPAKKVQCNLCKKIGHYSKVCRSAKLMWQTQQIKPQQSTPYQNIPQTRRVRNIRQSHEQQQIPTQEQTQTDTTEETVDLENTLYIQEVFDNWKTVNLVQPKTFTDAQPHKLSPKIPDEIWIKTTEGTTEINWLADTGSPRSFICKTEAERILRACRTAKWKDPTGNNTQYRCFNNIEIPIIGTIEMDLLSGQRKALKNEILVVDANTVNLLGRDILGKLGFTLTQNKGTYINNIIADDTLQIKIINKFPHLCTRLGKSKNHIAKSTLKQDITPYQHKGRRVPLHLTDKVDKEIQHLLNTKQIVKLDKCSDQVFISPVVITVKHDQSIKLALDSKLLNDAIDKNKYQMQSIDNLMDSVAKYISDNKNKHGNFLFSKIDLKYAYSQIPLHPEIRKHCNFNILGGKSTGTYQFVNGFYGLSDMPATFQKTLDKTLENIDNKFNFLDDILIITKGSPSEHETDIYKVLSKLDKENLAIKLEKCEFAKTTITWLGYKITQSGTSPTIKKTDSILNLKPPNTLKQLRSLMGSVHQLIKFIPNLANLLNPIRPLLKKDNITNNKIRWEDYHTTALNKIKAEISNITEKKHFDKQRNTRLKCDASHTGLGAVLEQQYPEGWFPIAYASRFLNEAEIKYSTNELELLSVVWATNHFKYYLLGSRFELITDHTALLSALKPNRANKSRQSRLIRWVDKLLPYTFTIHHLPGKDMGFTDYLSRNPHQKPPPQ